MVSLSGGEGGVSLMHLVAQQLIVHAHAAARHSHARARAKHMLSGRHEQHEVLPFDLARDILPTSLLEPKTNRDADRARRTHFHPELSLHF